MNVFDVLIASVTHLYGIRKKKKQRQPIMAQLYLAHSLGNSRALALVEFW